MHICDSVMVNAPTKSNMSVIFALNKDMTKLVIVDRCSVSTNIWIIKFRCSVHEVNYFDFNLQTIEDFSFFSNPRTFIMLPFQHLKGVLALIFKKVFKKFHSRQIEHN